MKKFLVVLLILAVAGGAFAQLTFSGGVMAGMGVQISNADKAKPTLSAMTLRQGVGAYRWDLNGAYTHADGNAGFNVRLRTGSVHRAELWLKALDGMLTIRGGHGVDTAGNLGMGGGIDDNLGLSGGNNALWINIAPIDGLDIRAVIQPNPNAFAIGDGLGKHRYSFGAAYTIPEIATVVFALRQGQTSLPYPLNATHVTTYSTNTNSASTGTGSTIRTETLGFGGGNVNRIPWKAMDIGLGIKVLALKDMGFTTLNLDFAFLNVMGIAYDDDLTGDAWAKSGNQNKVIRLGQNVVYAATPELEIGARFMQQIPIIGNSDVKEGLEDIISPDLSFAVYATYLMGNVVPRFDFGFNIGTSAGQVAPGADGFAARTAYWDSIAKNGFEKDRMNMSISPSVQFRFGSSNHYIDLGYNLIADLSKGDNKPADGDATMMHSFGIDYRVTF